MLTGLRVNKIEIWKQHPPVRTLLFQAYVFSFIHSVAACFTFEYSVGSYLGMSPVAYPASH